MAGEIVFSHTTGRTCYAQVWNNVGQIYNTASAAFQAYATANIADYDIAATEQGTASGIYVASMPAVAAGVYGVVAKERAGGSPAESDTVVGEGDILWDGSIVGLSLTPTGVDGILDEDVEGAFSLRESMRLANSANAGKLSGASTANVLIRDVADTKNRINATVDSNGNRTAITLDVS